MMSFLSGPQVRLNRYIVYLFVVDLVICAGLTAGGVASAAQQDGLWYLGMAKRLPGEEAQNFLTYFILLSAFIPLALMVSMEMAILIQSLFMRWDDNMVCSSNKRMMPYTSSLNSELGLVGPAEKRRDNVLRCYSLYTCVPRRMDVSWLSGLVSVSKALGTLRFEATIHTNGWITRLC